MLILHHLLSDCEVFFLPIYLWLKRLVFVKVVEFMVYLLNGTNHTLKTYTQNMKLKNTQPMVSELWSWNIQTFILIS